MNIFNLGEHVVINSSNTIEFDVRRMQDPSKHRFMTHKEVLEHASKYHLEFDINMDKLSEEDYENKICELLEDIPGGIVEIDNPTEKMIISSIKSDYTVFEFLKNPSQKVKGIYYQEFNRQTGDKQILNTVENSYEQYTTPEGEKKFKCIPVEHEDKVVVVDGKLYELKNNKGELR